MNIQDKKQRMFFMSSVISERQVIYNGLTKDSLQEETDETSRQHVQLGRFGNGLCTLCDHYPGASNQKHDHLQKSVLINFVRWIENI